MREFLENAGQILDAATGVRDAGSTPSDVAVLIGEDGAIHMVMDPDGSAEDLARSRGWPAAYLVSQRDGHIRVDGACRGQSCRLEARSARDAARRLLADRPRYRLA